MNVFYVFIITGSISTVLGIRWLCLWHRSKESTEFQASRPLYWINSKIQVGRIRPPCTRFILLWSAVWGNAVNATPNFKKSIFWSELSSKYLWALEKLAKFADFFFISKVKSQARDFHRPLLLLTSKSWIQRNFSLFHLLPSVISKVLLLKWRITGNINKRGQYIELCGLFLFWEYSCLYVLTLRKIWSVPIYIKRRGEAKSEEEPKQKLWSGLSNGKLITPGILTSLVKARLVRGPSGCLKLIHTAMCHKDHSRSWQWKLEMSESKRGVGRCHCGEHLWCLQYEKKTKTNHWLKNGPVWLARWKWMKKKKKKGEEQSKDKKEVILLFIQGILGHWKSSPIHSIIFCLLPVLC